MFANWRDFGSKLIKSSVLRGYGWESRVHNRFGQRTMQWRHPGTGLWYGEATAMRILRIDLVAPYNR